MKLFLGIVLSTFCFFACSKANRGQHNTATSTTNQDLDNEKGIDYTQVELKIERGAFHYDKFVLADTTITFFPSLDGFKSEFDKYNRISKQRISKENRDKLIRHLIDNDIFDLNEVYPCSASCSSGLIVTLNINNRTKKIICDDFKLDCPALMQFIEQEILRLHGKNLKRIMLPG